MLEELTQLDEDKINYDLMVELLKHIDKQERPKDKGNGAILVFLPGLMEVRTESQVLQPTSIHGPVDFYFVRKTDVREGNVWEPKAVCGVPFALHPHQQRTKGHFQSTAARRAQNSHFH